MCRAQSTPCSSQLIWCECRIKELEDFLDASLKREVVLLSWQEKVFQCHPNIDLDIEYLIR